MCLRQVWCLASAHCGTITVSSSTARAGEKAKRTPEINLLARTPKMPTPPAISGITRILLWYRMTQSNFSSGAACTAKP